MSTGNPLTSGLFFYKKILSVPPFYLAADCELPKESKPKRELVTLTAVVAVPHYKSVHNRKVNEKVKQIVPQFE
jgi:hypothetical protein